MNRLMLAMLTTTAMAVPVFAQAATASPRAATATHAVVKAESRRTTGVKKHRAGRKTGVKRHSAAHHAPKSWLATKP